MILVLLLIIIIQMLLFKHATAQHFHFLLCEEAPVTTTEVLFGEPGKLHTVEP